MGRFCFGAQPCADVFLPARFLFAVHSDDLSFYVVRIDQRAAPEGTSVNSGYLNSTMPALPSTVII